MTKHDYLMQRQRLLDALQRVMGWTIVSHSDTSTLFSNVNINTVALQAEDLGFERDRLLLNHSLDRRHGHLQVQVIDSVLLQITLRGVPKANGTYGDAEAVVRLAPDTPENRKLFISKHCQAIAVAIRREMIQLLMHDPQCLAQAITHNAKTYLEDTLIERAGNALQGLSQSLTNPDSGYSSR